VLSQFASRFEVLNGGRGRIEGTSALIGYSVRYTAVYAKPSIGAKIVGKVISITGALAEQLFVMSEVDGEIVCITKEID